MAMAVEMAHPEANSHSQAKKLWTQHSKFRRVGKWAGCNNKQVIFELGKQQCAVLARFVKTLEMQEKRKNIQEFRKQTNKYIHIHAAL